MQFPRFPHISSYQSNLVLVARGPAGSNIYHEGPAGCPARPQPYLTGDRSALGRSKPRRTPFADFSDSDPFAA
eukprot:1320787-Prymnesium_polylepis.1